MDSVYVERDTYFEGELMGYDDNDIFKEYSGEILADKKASYESELSNFKKLAQIVKAEGYFWIADRYIQEYWSNIMCRLDMAGSEGSLNDNCIMQFEHSGEHIPYDIESVVRPIITLKGDVNVEWDGVEYDGYVLK